MSWWTLLIKWPQKFITRNIKQSTPLSGKKTKVIFYYLNKIHMGPEDQAAFEDRFKEAVKRWGPEDQVSLEDRFREAVTRWEAHCEANSIHSDPAKYVEFSSVNEIFAMGREALPLIKAYLIKHPDSKILPPLWVILVRAIGVELKIPKKIRGYTERIRAHLIAVLSASQPFAKD